MKWPDVPICPICGGIDSCLPYRCDQNGLVNHIHDKDDLIRKDIETRPRIKHKVKA
jgi:hypothetical protein